MSTARFSWSRRGFVRSLAAGSALLPALLRELAAENADAVADPLAPREPRFPPKAKRVIFLYFSGGVSHIDAWDPKPRLFADHGKPMSVDDPQAKALNAYTSGFVKRPMWEFRRHGKSGIEVSDLFPHVAECVDDITFIRSMHTSHQNHYNATLGIHTGSFTFARPSLGAWVSYGLGTENANLPSFVVLAPASPYAGAQVWASDFLPACHQGTRVIPGAEPIPNLARRGRNERVQTLELGALREWNQEHLAARAGDPLLAARLKSFETAFGMQMEAPEAFDFSHEKDATLAMYGLQRGQTSGFGWQCLAARRLVERGVRFVELIDGGSADNWDQHDTMTKHGPRAKATDLPVAGLLRDLKDRGMLAETLVVWATEFGRTPFSKDAENGGREHHAWAFTCWMAGAGVKPGMVHGETDEQGWKVVKDPVHVHDFHATILHLLGFDHKRLTFRHAGRDFRLTDVEGNVVQAILS
ncbi:MAG: DUF1501 domain-containing protein [Planctomycetota bacterium]|nr:DUF1501 domain-containing protein [Planctomycetota bacterium]